MKSLEDLAAEAFGTVTQILARYGHPPNSKGQVRCPFHDDKSPSFSVKATSKGERWRCWAGCGGGDSIALEAMFQGVDSKEICRQLRRGSGKVERVRVRRTPQPKAPAEPEIDLAQRSAVLCWMYSQLYPFEIESPVEGQWRGLTFETLGRAGVRHCSNHAWRRLRTTAVESFGSIADQVLSKSISLKVGNVWHNFDDFVVFPYWEPAAFRGLRMLRFRNADTDAPKAARYTQTKMFGVQPVPFMGSYNLACTANPALYMAPSDIEDVRTLYVCEGEIDAMSVRQMGNLVIGVPGASSWRDEWCETWPRFNKINVMADGDSAGDNLWERIIKACHAKHGARWTNTHLEAISATNHDANDLLNMGQLQEVCHG
jgi:hypothetical protein